MTIRLLIVDDQDLIRTGFRLFLQTQNDLEVVGEAADGHQALTQAAALRPDVVLMDIRMPRMDGIEATSRLTASAPSPRVLVLTTYDLDEYVFGALRAGASGFLLKDAPPEQLAWAIRNVVAGRRVIDPHLAVSTWEGGENPLSARELEVLRGAAQGADPTEIATVLHLSVGTVRNYLTNIVTKMNARNRVDAIRAAREAGWLP